MTAFTDQQAAELFTLMAQHIEQWSATQSESALTSERLSGESLRFILAAVGEAKEPEFSRSPDAYRHVLPNGKMFGDGKSYQLLGDFDSAYNEWMIFGGKLQSLFHGAIDGGSVNLTLIAALQRARANLDISMNGNDFRKLADQIDAALAGAGVRP